MQDFFQVLDVPRNATQSQIKHAFRKKAKSLHPDTSGKDGEQMRLLIQAYRTLSALVSKDKFKAEFSYEEADFSESSSFDYAVWLSKRDDLPSRTKLIFYFLLHDKETEACEEFLSLQEKNPNFTLEDYFDREDFMDIGFILAEELYFRQKYFESCSILLRVFVLEKEKEYFKIFFPEVYALLFDILKNKLAFNVCDELALDCWEEALELGLEKKDDAVIFGRMAEAFFRIGDIDSSKACLREALKLDKALTGFARIKKILG